MALNNFKKTQQDAVTNPAAVAAMSTGAHAAGVAAAQTPLMAMAAHNLQKQYEAATRPTQEFAKSAQAHANHLSMASKNYAEALQDKFQKQAEAAQVPMTTLAKSQTHPHAQHLKNSSKNLQ